MDAVPATFHTLSATTNPVTVWARAGSAEATASSPSRITRTPRGPRVSANRPAGNWPDNPMAVDTAMARAT